MLRPALLAGAGLALAVTLTGCAAAAPAATMNITPGPTHTSVAPIDPDASQAPSGDTLSTGLAAAAVRAARNVMTRYARPQLSSSAWLAGLDPYLTQDAAAAFQHTDPSTIPAHRIAGSITLSGDSTAAGAIATIPTDAGTYTVLLLRDKQSRSWLADTITPPAQ